VTFSIVARSPDGETFGVAVASKFLAVGAAVPAAESGVGAVATQAWANLQYRPDGLRLLREGRAAADVLDALTAGDEGRAERQAGVVARTGDGATYTGPECMSWAGGRAGDGYAVQGNILTGPGVVEAMELAWLDSTGEPHPRRLLAALAAGDAAGGDRRGRQSAALLVVTPDGGYGGGSDVLVDLRVDDHPAPVGELARLLDLHRLYFERPDPADCVELSGDVAGEVRARLAGLGFSASGADPDALDAALADWAGMANLEERLVAGRIDPLVLEQLRAAEPAG